MWKIIKNIFRTVIFIITKLVEVILQHFFARKLLLPYLKNTPPRLKSKIINYASYVPTASVYRFLDMIGRPRNKTNKEIATYICTILPIYDEITDYEGYTAEEQDYLYKNFESRKPQNIHEELAITLYKKLLDIIPAENKAGFKKYSDKIHKAQLESKKQKTGNISMDEILRITADKGGYSILFSASAFMPEISEQEEEALHKLGFWIQLVDDITDSQQDKKDGIRTFPNATENRDEVIRYTEKTKREAFSAVRVLGYPPAKVEKTLFALNFLCESAYGYFKNRKESDDTSMSFEREMLVFLHSLLFSLPRIVMYD